MTRWKKNLYTLWFSQILATSGFGFGFPFMPFYIQELGVYGDEQVKFWVGLLASVSGLTFALVAPVWGLLADRFGRKIMILRATLAGAIVMAALSLAPNVYVVLVIRILQGIFTGTVTAAATLVAAGTPNDKISFSLGFLASSAYIGNSLGPFIGGFASEWLGHRYSFLLGAVVILIGFFLVLVLVKEEPVPEAGTQPLHKKPLRWRELRGLLSFVILANLAVIFFTRFTNELSKPFIAVYTQELLGTEQGASILTGNLQAAQGVLTFAASVVFGLLGDKIARGPFIAFFLLCAAACNFAIFAVPSLIAFVIFFPLAAFFMTGTGPLTQATISLATPPHRRGMIFGIQTAVSSSAWAIAPILGSALSVNRSAGVIFFASTITLLVEVALMVVLTLVQNKRTARTPM